jgi:predicted HAD superfamily Cof-like phosphohydrolase
LGESVTYGRDSAEVRLFPRVEKLIHMLYLGYSSLRLLK